MGSCLAVGTGKQLRRQSLLISFNAQDDAGGCAMTVTLDRNLRTMLAKAKSVGFLTYDEVSDYLPDEDISSDRLTELLVAIEDNRIHVIDKPQRNFEEPVLNAAPDDADRENPMLIPFEEQRKVGDDPIRMYLAQMSGIPLLTRKEEILLAKKIELAANDFGAACSVATLPCGPPWKY